MGQIFTRYPAEKTLVTTKNTAAEALKYIDENGGPMKLDVKNGSIEFAYNGLVAWVNEKDIWVNHTPAGVEIIMAMADAKRT